MPAAKSLVATNSVAFTVVALITPETEILSATMVCAESFEAIDAELALRMLVPIEPADKFPDTSRVLALHDLETERRCTETLAAASVLCTVSDWSTSKSSTVPFSAMRSPSRCSIAAGWRSLRRLMPTLPSQVRSNRLRSTSAPFLVSKESPPLFRLSS